MAVVNSGLERIKYEDLSGVISTTSSNPYDALLTASGGSMVNSIACDSVFGNKH